MMTPRPRARGWGPGPLPRLLPVLLLLLLAACQGGAGGPKRLLRPAGEPGGVMGEGKGLAALGATRGIAVGVGVHPTRFGDPPTAATIRHEFGYVTPEVALKWEFIHPCPPPALSDPASPRHNAAVAAWVAADGSDRCDGSAAAEWDWALMDQIVEWAESNGLDVYGHTLSWHQQNPPWLTREALSPAERERLLHDHIRNIIHHYCDRRVVAYDVVNEAIGPDGLPVPLGPWYDIPDYVDHAFHVARAALDECHATPDEVKLYYNDWGIEFGRVQHFEMFMAQPGEYNKTESVYRELQRLLSGDDPTPIDGLGMQGHLKIGGPDPYPQDMAAMVREMERFAALGLELRLTEIDVGIYEAEAAPYLAAQAEQFGGAAAACRAVAACIGFATWGLLDGQSWLGGEHAPLLFGDEICGDSYCAKPGYFAVREAWKR